MTHTTIEQSKKLLELGLSPETADMYYEDDISIVVGHSWHEQHIPCWSVGALLEIFNDKAGVAKEYETWFAYDNGKSHCTKHYINSIDACFEMVCWLLENNKL